MKVKSLVTNSWFTKDKTYEVIIIHGTEYLIDDLDLEVNKLRKNV